MLNMLDKNMISKLMAMESFISIMEIFYKDNLRMVDVKEKPDGSNLMEATIKVISKIMSLMVTESISTLMDINMKGNGRIISPMERDKLSILTEADTMVNFSTIKDTVKEFLPKKAKYLMAILNTIKWMDLESYNSKTDKDMKENGSIIKNMVLGNTDGQMVVSIKEVTLMEKEMVKEK